MMISDDGRTDCLIVGAGALGLLVAASIKKSQQNSRRKGHVGVFNRRLLCHPVSVGLPDGEASDLSSCIHTETPAWFTDSSRNRFVFFCLPPESTEEASLSFLKSTKKICDSFQNITFVFCNNGCLPQSVINAFKAIGASTLRALLFIGALRREDSSGCTVTWTGGNRAAWNVIIPAPPSSLAFERDELQRMSFPMCSGERFVDWLQTDNIGAMERCKFFTNFMLAAGIGRRKDKNKSLYRHLNSGTLDMAASQCAQLWKLHGVNENDLKSVLSQTVAATEENFNSLSLAGAHGNDNTMRWFLDFLEAEISRAADVSDFDQLNRFIENVRVEWGM